MTAKRFLLFLFLFLFAIIGIAVADDAKPQVPQPKVDELVELLGRYENERDKYPTLDEFMPEIVKMQNEIVTAEYIAELREQAKKRAEDRARGVSQGNVR